MNVTPNTKSIAYDIAVDFTLRNNKLGSFDVYFLDFSGWEDIRFYPGVDYSNKVSNPIIALGDLNAIKNFDYVHNDRNYFLISTRMINFIKSARQSDDYIIHPVRIYHSKNTDEASTLETADLLGRKWSDEYAIVQCKAVIDVLDSEASEVARLSFSLYGKPPAIVNVYHFAFRVESDEGLPLIFQIPELTRFFVSKTAKELMETHDIRGVVFRELP